MDKEEKQKPILDKYAAMMTKFQRVLNSSETGSFQGVVYAYFDTIMPKVCHNRELPSRNGESITKQDVEQLVQAVNEEYALLRGGLKQSKDSNKVEFGFFLKELLAAMDTATAFELYSGHDTTIQALLAMMESKDLNWPPYASNLVFEHWKTTGNKKIVRVLYNGSPLQADWCDFGKGCPVETFLSKLRPFVPDVNKDC
jgi:hypothetical protein